MTTGKIVICTSIICDIALNFNVLKRTFFEKFFKLGIPDIKRNIIFTSSMCLITLVISIYSSNVILYISICGGLASTIYCFIIPTVLYYKSSESNFTQIHMIIISICCFIVSVIGIACGITSVIDEINNGKKHDFVLCLIIKKSYI